MLEYPIISYPYPHQVHIPFFVPSIWNGLLQVISTRPCLRQHHRWKAAGCKLWMSAARHHQTAQPRCFDALGIRGDGLLGCCALHQTSHCHRQISLQKDFILAKPCFCCIHMFHMLSGRPKIPKSASENNQAFCSRTKRCEKAELLSRSPSSGIPDKRTFSVGTWLAWKGPGT